MFGGGFLMKVYAGAAYHSARANMREDLSQHSKTLSPNQAADS